MISRIRDYFINDAVPIGERALTLITAYTVSVMLLGLFVFIHIGDIFESLISVGVSCVALTGLWIFVRKYNMYRIGSVIFSYFLNMICLPMFYILGGGLYGGMEFLFVTGVIITFFVLEGVQLFIAACVDVTWYVIVLLITFYDPRIIQNTPHGMRAYISFTFIFLVSIIVPCIVFEFQNLVFRLQKERVMESLKSIGIASQTKSRFLANMSHELRTPMNAILGMTNLISKEDRDNVASEDVRLIKETATSLLTTINDILTYSKLESEKLELIPEQYNFDKMMNDIIYNISAETEEKDIEFYADIAPDIPNVLYGDDTKLMQIFQYLMFYAVSNTESGRIMMDVKCRRNREMNSVTILVRISDTGEGLSREDLDSIYTSYETYDSRRDSRLKRFGLELTICKGLLEKMKGDIRIESIADVGSAVSFSFDNFIIENVPVIDVSEIKPADTLIYCHSTYIRKRWDRLMSECRQIADFVDTNDDFAESLKQKDYDVIFIPQNKYGELKGAVPDKMSKRVYVITDHQHSVGDFGKFRIVRKPLISINISEIFLKKWDRREYENPNAQGTFTAPEANVLLVDDNLVNIKVGEELLKKYNVKITSAGSGKDAIDKVIENDYDIIFLDHIMPEMDGIETLHQIRKCKKDSAAVIPVISMTANMGEDIRKEMLGAGFQDYLAKPVKVRYLEQILLNFLPEDKIIRTKESKAGELRETAEADSPEADLSESQAFDMSAGIANIGGNTEVYDSILMVYYNEGMARADDIAAEYAHDADMKRFITDVHSMKGSSANIGASDMSSDFRALEMAGKAGDRDFIEKELDNTLKKFRALLDYIKQYLMDKGIFRGEDTASEEDDFDDDRVLEMFEMDDAIDLKNELSGENYEECRRIIESLCTRNFGQKINRQISEMKEEFEKEDYAGMKERLTDMMMSMQ